MKEQTKPLFEVGVEESEDFYIKLPETLVRNPEFKPEQLGLFMDVLFSCNIKPKQTLFGGNVITCEAGSFVTLPHMLNKKSQYKTDQHLVDLLDSLVEWGLIECTKKNGALLIKVNNWEYFYAGQ